MSPFRIVLDIRKKSIENYIVFSDSISIIAKTVIWNLYKPRH